MSQFDSPDITNNPAFGSLAFGRPLPDIHPNSDDEWMQPHLDTPPPLKEKVDKGQGQKTISKPPQKTISKPPQKTISKPPQKTPRHGVGKTLPKKTLPKIGKPPVSKLKPSVAIGDALYRILTDHKKIGLILKKANEIQKSQDRLFIDTRYAFPPGHPKLTKTNNAKKKKREMTYWQYLVSKHGVKKAAYIYEHDPAVGANMKKHEARILKTKDEWIQRAIRSGRKKK